MTARAQEFAGGRRCACQPARQAHRSGVPTAHFGDRSHLCLLLPHWARRSGVRMRNRDLVAFPSAPTFLRDRPAWRGPSTSSRLEFPWLRTQIESCAAARVVRRLHRGQRNCWHLQAQCRWSAQEEEEGEQVSVLALAGLPRGRPRPPGLVFSIPLQPANSKIGS